MTDQLPEGSVLVHRADILNGLQALHLAQYKFDRFLKEDSYTCGYREGFEDALLSIAQMVGVSDEFEATRQHLNSFKFSSLPIYNTNTK